MSPRVGLRPRACRKIEAGWLQAALVVGLFWPCVLFFVLRFSSSGCWLRQLDRQRLLDAAQQLCSRRRGDCTGRRGCVVDAPATECRRNRPKQMGVTCQLRSALRNRTLLMRSKRSQSKSAEPPYEMLGSSSAEGTAVAPGKHDGAVKDSQLHAQLCSLQGLTAWKPALPSEEQRDVSEGEETCPCSARNSVGQGLCSSVASLSYIDEASLSLHITIAASKVLVGVVYVCRPLASSCASACVMCDASFPNL